MSALPLPRIVEMVRVSTKAQQDEGTPETQLAGLERLRLSRPGNPVCPPIVIAVSGQKGLAERKDLQQLKKLSDEKAIDEIRCWNLDRFTRADDPRDRIAVYGIALDCGAKIVDCSGKVIDPAKGGMGEIDYYLQTFFAAAERRKIVERYHEGKRRKAKEGQLSQGKPPYARRLFHFKKVENGETIKTAEWRIVPEEFKTYRRIIDLTLEGKTTRQICATLNTEGVPARVGQKWRHSTIKRLLHTPAIVGEYRPYPDCLTMIPPVATHAEWKKLQERLKANGGKSGPRRVLPALLRGKLTCAACGKRTVVLSDGSGSVPRYGCPKGCDRDTPCPERPTVRAPYADRHFRVALGTLLGSSDDLLAAIKALNSKPAPDMKQELESAEKELAKLDVRQTRTLSLLNEGLVTDAAGRDELRKIRDLRELAEAKKARSSAAPSYSYSQAKGQLLKAAKELGEAVAEASDARMSELLDILFPPHPPFFLRLSRAGIEGVGLLPLSGDPDSTTSRCDRISGVPFRITLPLEERRAKLTATQVKEIRANYAKGHITQTQLAQLYGVNVSMVNRIVHGKRWAR